MLQIPFTTIRIGFMCTHWVDACEMCHGGGAKAIFTWFVNAPYSFGLVNDHGDYIFILTHSGELE